MGVYVAIMQVVVFAVHYAHDCFYCNFAGDSFFYSYVGDSFIWQFHIPFSNWQPLFIKVTRKHFTTFVNILPKLRYFEGRNYTNWLQELFSTFVFLIDLWKEGTSWISRKGGILEKGGMTPLNQLCTCLFSQHWSLFVRRSKH